jgi:hypothetical protein
LENCASSEGVRVPEPLLACWIGPLPKNGIIVRYMTR